MGGESLPLAVRVSEGNSVVSESERTTPSPRGTKQVSFPLKPLIHHYMVRIVPKKWNTKYKSLG